MSNYSAAVLADSPVVFLELDEVSGTSVADTGSNATAWTYQTGVALAQSPVFPGVGGTSVKASGTTSAALIASVPAALSNPRGTSIEVSVNLPSTSLSGAFVHVGDTTGGWGVGVGSGTYGTAGNHLIVSQDGVATYDSGINIGTGSHYIVVTNDASGNLNFYIDGALVKTLSAAVPLTAVNDMYVGGYSTFNVANTVTIDEVALYGAVLTGAQVSTHWAATSANAALSNSYIEAATIPTGTPAALSSAYVEVVSTPSVTPAALSAAYVEAVTIPTVTPAALSGVYIEVLSQTSPPAFEGWGVSI